MGEKPLTLCSSCLTSTAVPSLKVHLYTSVSELVFETFSDLSRARQNLWKSPSLMKCQTLVSGARRTALTLTSLVVGVDMFGFDVGRFVAGRRMVSLLVSVSIDEWTRATMFEVLDIAEDQISRCGVDD